MLSTFYLVYLFYEPVISKLKLNFVVWDIGFYFNWGWWFIKNWDKSLFHILIILKFCLFTSFFLYLYLFSEFIYRMIGTYFVFSTRKCVCVRVDRWMNILPLFILQDAKIYTTFLNINFDILKSYVGIWRKSRYFGLLTKCHKSMLRKCYNKYFLSQTVQEYFIRRSLQRRATQSSRVLSGSLREL